MTHSYRKPSVSLASCVSLAHMLIQVKSHL